ncbi:MAG: NAD(P)/FAD-dependent oxidoreductase [Acidobacteria bacterium]|nr:NAD(P)/FAD-dependent oxidoreductase [Acidobacteriota bacterium]
MKVYGREYPADYDVIVIGSGIGGLFCANLLAQAGLRVLIIEQHYVLGGYCSTFRRKKFIFDAATHFYPLLGNPSTFPGKLLNKLGISTEWIKMDPVDKFHFPDGETFVVPADFSLYLRRLKDRFPHQATQIDRFFAEVREAYLYGLLYYFRDIPNEKAEKYRFCTVEEKLLEHFQDPKLRAYLIADHSHWGSLPSRTSFLFDSTLRLAYFLGNYYPRGGSQVFADALGDSLKQKGGHVLLCSAVQRILIEQGRAVGVAVQPRFGHSKESVAFRAPVVVSNADMVQTYRRLIGEEHCGRAVIDGLMQLRPSIPCFITHMGLKKLPRQVMESIEGYYWTSWDPEDLIRTFFKVFFTTLLDASVAPPNHDILIIQKWNAVEYDKVVNWREVKQETEHYIMGQLRRILPGIDNHIVIQLSAAANTSYQYTLNHQGAMLGWEMSPEQLGSLRPANETAIQNLYLVGHWTQPGGGIVPVIVSAQRVADRILTGRSKAASCAGSFEHEPPDLSRHEIKEGKGYE